jgi:sugar phosphate isomerase/epimerase
LKQGLFQHLPRGHFNESRILASAPGQFPIDAHSDTFKAATGRLRQGGGIVTVHPLRLCLSGTELAAGESCSALVEACTLLNAGGVELWYPENTAEIGLERTIRTFNDSGLSVVTLSSGIELYRDRDADVQQRKLVDLVRDAGRLGVHRVNTYFGFGAVADDGASTDGYLRLVEPALKMASNNGVVIVIENEFDAFGWDPAGSDITRRPRSFLALLDAAASDNLKTTFDPANYVCAGVSPQEAFAVLGRHIAYVHVKDVVSRTEAEGALPGWKSYSDHNRFYSTCPLGEGEVGWPELFNTLADAAYDGPFCLEPHAERQGRDEAWRQASATLRSYATQYDDTP